MKYNVNHKVNRVLDSLSQSINNTCQEFFLRNRIPDDMKDILLERIAIKNRFRPSELSVITELEFGGNYIKENPEIALSIELLHISSLIHDDIIDRHTKRWHLPTINNFRSDEFALLVGDLCMSLSQKLSSDIGTKINIPLIGSCFSDAAVRISLGQIYDLNLTNHPGLIKKKEYLEIAIMKTSIGLLSCQIALLLTKSTDTDFEVIMDYAQSLGITSQIANDISEISNVRGFKNPNYINDRGPNENVIGRKSVLDIEEFQPNTNNIVESIIDKAIYWYKDIKLSAKEKLQRIKGPTPYLSSYLSQANPIHFNNKIIL